MKTVVLGLLAETSIHSGSGRSVGVIDLPVARESITCYPVIPGSSLKGSLRDKAESFKHGDANEWFGDQTGAGKLLVSDCRLLFLPVRSLIGSMKWATCPLLIERFQRDLTRAGFCLQFSVPAVEDGTALSRDDDVIYLEERQFNVVGPPPEDFVQATGFLVLHDATRKRLFRQLVVLSDNDFRWFAEFGLPVQARNKLNDDKRSEGLWYEETLPPDTVMYALITSRTSEGIDYVKNLFSSKYTPYLQAGGNETTGQGWFAVSVQVGGHQNS